MSGQAPVHDASGRTGKNDASAGTGVGLAPGTSGEHGPARRALRRLLARRAAVFGLIVVALMALLALAAPWIAPFDPLATSWKAVRKAPSLAHWFGTDEVGRDLFSRVIWGGRASMAAGLISVSIAVGVGVPLGMLAGYVGGLLDAAISRLTDAMLAIPFLILAIALAAFLGPSLGNAMIAIGVTATPIFVRLSRGQVLAVRAEEYVEAARAVGNPPARILLRHILPNILPPVIVQATLAIAAAIIAEASLSFLGLGQQPPSPSWGSMLNTAQRFLTQAPWMAIFPGLAIFITVLAFNLLGDGLCLRVRPHPAGARGPARRNRAGPGTRSPGPAARVRAGLAQRAAGHRLRSTAARCARRAARRRAQRHPGARTAGSGARSHPGCARGRCRHPDQHRRRHADRCGQGGAGRADA
jgi:peptide/nickel transport system permease protein